MVLEALFVGNDDGVVGGKAAVVVVEGIMTLEDTVAAKRQGLGMLDACGSLGFSFWRFHTSIATHLHASLLTSITGALSSTLDISTPQL